MEDPGVKCAKDAKGFAPVTPIKGPTPPHGSRGAMSGCVAPGDH